MKRSRWFVLLALLSSLLIVFGACAEDDDGGDNGDTGTATGECPEGDECVEIAEGDPVVLGTLLVISGPNASLGLDSQHGVELAVDFRETPGEVAGHPIEFEHQDDGCAAEGGQTGAQALVSRPEIFAVIGTSCSSAAEPASQILTEGKTLLISPSNTAPNLTDPETHEEFYARTAHNDLIQGAAMAQFVSEELGAKTAATIHDGSPYAEGLANVFSDKFASDFDGEITTEEAVSVGEKQFGPLLTSIAADAPDFLYYPVFIPEGAGITQAARETSGLEDTDLGGADGMLSPDFVEAAGEENSEGMYLSGPSLAFEDSFYEEEFLPAYEEKFGEKPAAPFHAHAFDATNIVLDAIETVAVETEDGGLLIPRQAFRDEVFATTDYDGVTGTLTCNETGDCQQEAEMAINEVVKGNVNNQVFTVTLKLEEAQS